MTNTIIGERAAVPTTDEWADRIAAQQRSGNSVKQFCKEQGLTEYSFYAWRKRLQKASRYVSLWWIEERYGRGRRRKRLWSWCWRPASGCASEPEWTQLRCGRSWKLYGHDPSAGQRAGVSLPDSQRHAPEL